MFLDERLFCELMLPWLTPRDLGMLCSGMSRALHAEIMLVVQSVQFRRFLGPQFKAILEDDDDEPFPHYSILRWLCLKGANMLNDVNLSIGSSFFDKFSVSALKSLPSVPFIGSAHIHPVAMVEDNVLIILKAFPRLQKVYFALNSHFSEASGALTAIAKFAKSEHCLLKDITLDFGSVRASIFIPIYSVDRIISFLGHQLEVLTIRHLRIPRSIIEAWIQHCPNATEIFSGNRFDETVSSSYYLEACMQLNCLRSLILTERCGFSLSNYQLISALQQLPGLRVLSLGVDQSVTVAAMTAALRLCPALEELCYRGQFEVKIQRTLEKEGKDLKATSSLEVIKYDSFVSEKEEMTSFLSLLPCVTSISLSELESYDLVDVVLGQLIMAGCAQHTKTLSLDCEGKEENPFRTYEEWLTHFPSLEELDLSNLQLARFVDGAGLAPFVPTLSSHCPVLNSLCLGSPLFLFDYALKTLINTLSSLQRFELTLTGGKENCLLTYGAMKFFAIPDRTWSLLSLPQRRYFSPQDVLDALSQHGLKAKELRFHHDMYKSFEFRPSFGIVTVEHVRKVFDRDLESLSSWKRKLA